MRKHLTTIEDGYSWEELYYDSEKEKFIIEKHHTGCVDDGADYYDGEYQVSAEKALSLLKKEGCIRLIIDYAKELNYRVKK